MAVDATPERRRPRGTTLGVAASLTQVEPPSTALGHQTHELESHGDVHHHSSSIRGSPRVILPEPPSSPVLVKTSTLAKDSPKSKKVVYRAPRDSLTRRLRPGRKGTRRRRRHDNKNFTDHPLIPNLVDEPEYLHINDLYPGPPLVRPPSTFIHVLETELRKVFVNASVDQVKRINDIFIATTQKQNVRKGSQPGEENLTKIDRRLRTQLRRSNSIGHDVVKEVEKLLIDAVMAGRRAGHEQRATKDNGWVIIEADEVDGEEGEEEISRPLCLHLDTPFLRLVVHAMCRYYLLTSHSETSGTGKRLTYIQQPTATYKLPRVTFWEYLFA